MNGLLMKGPKAFNPAPATDEQVNNITDEVKAACGKQSDDTVSGRKKMRTRRRRSQKR